MHYHYAPLNGVGNVSSMRERCELMLPCIDSPIYNGNRGNLREGRVDKMKKVENGEIGQMRFWINLMKQIWRKSRVYLFKEAVFFLKKKKSVRTF